MTENLKFILGRYDHYIESVHSKSNVIITLNTFILTGAVTLFAGFKSDLNEFLTGCLISIILVSIISTIYILVAISPQTKRSSKNSVIFFGNVSNMKSDVEYLKTLKKTDYQEFEADLAHQVHQVAKIVCKKHEELKNAGYLLIMQFILIATWLTLFILKTKTGI